MPELPEVETIKRGVEPFLDKKIIKDIQVNRYDLRFKIPQSIRQDVQGQTINKLNRHGKYLLLDLSNSKTIIWHMGMSGTVKIFSDEKYEPRKHDHVIITTNDNAMVVYNDPRRFGMFYTKESHDVSITPPFSKMGPDAISCTPQELFNNLQTKKSPIKTALLDQSVIAGLGNIYVCEALFKSGISPLCPSNALTQDQIDILLRHSQEILAVAIKNGGSTLKDHRLTDGSMGYMQNFFSVYGRKGLPCNDCTCDHDKTGGIAQIKQSGRSTFYCPQKQK